MTNPSIVLAAGWLVMATALAAPAAADRQPPEVTVTTVLEGLHTPCGVAVQPGTGHVFVSDSAAGRIVRVMPSGDEPVITDFPLDTYGEGTYEQNTRFDIGPLGLAFLSPDVLLVGGGGLKDGEDLLRVYDVPQPGTSIKADVMKQKVGPLAASNQSAVGEGNFYGVAVGQNAILITCNGDDEKGWIAKSDLSSGKAGPLKPFIATKVATKTDAPVGLTISSEGYVVVGQMGELDKPKDSLLTFYDIKGGSLLAAFPTGLHDITALAYSPASGLLYAIDFAWGEHAADGGLYRLDAVVVDGRPSVAAVKVAEITMPTAMVFAPNNALYITTIGARGDGTNNKTGKLIRVTGKL